jgi:hypothetical protein
MKKLIVCNITTFHLMNILPEMILIIHPSGYLAVSGNYASLKTDIKFTNLLELIDFALKNKSMFDDIIFWQNSLVKIRYEILHFVAFQMLLKKNCKMTIPCLPHEKKFNFIESYKDSIRCMLNKSPIGSNFLLFDVVHGSNLSDSAINLKRSIEKYNSDVLHAIKNDPTIPNLSNGFEVIQKAREISDATGYANIVTFLSQ